MSAHQYGIALTDDNLDLIQFLNDGVRLEAITKPTTYFVFRIHGINANEITSKVKTEDELYQRDGFLKDGPINFVW